MSTFDKTHRHSYGPAVADDGTPAGYPQDDTDHDLTVVRFDDVTDPANPRPLANLVNFSLHPEFLNGNDLISADYVAPLQRMVDRATGGLTVFTQNAVGTAEPERSTYHSMHERLEFTHREYAQAEYGARLMADAITDTWRDVERVTPERPDRFVPFDDSLEVAMEDRWFPGPLSHPYPGVSNCRADKAFEGDPQFPVVGLPDLRERGRGPAEHRQHLRTATTARSAKRADRSRHQHGRLPVTRDPPARKLLGALVHRAGGGRQRAPAGVPAGRHPVHGLLVRAVEGSVIRHQDPNRHHRGEPVHRLRLGLTLHL